MKNILTEDTRKNLVAAFQRVADDIHYGIVGTAASYSEITVRVMLNTLRDQQLLTKYGYDELCKLLETMKATDTPVDNMTNIINRVEDIVETEWHWQCRAPLYAYPLPFGKAHAIRRCITDLMNGDKAMWASFSEMHDTLYIYNIVESSILEKLHKLALKVYYGEYQGTYEELRDKVYEITGTDG